MKRKMKTLFSMALVAVACFGFVTVVFANSMTAKIYGGNSIEVIDNKDTSFRTTISASQISGGDVSVTTKISRKVLGFWVGNSASTQTIQYVNYTYYTDWNANGTNITTRATFVNNTGNTYIEGVFSLN